MKYLRGFNTQTYKIGNKDFLMNDIFLTTANLRLRIGSLFCFSFGHYPSG